MKKWKIEIDSNDCEYMTIDLPEDMVNGAVKVGCSHPENEEGSCHIDYCPRAVNNTSIEYQKHEFCRAVKCIHYYSAVGFKEEYCGKDNLSCTHTAKEFHHWLEENGYRIVKEG